VTGELSALKPAGLLLLIGGLFLAGLLAVGWSGAARLIVPSPDDTAGEMLHALLANREPAAHRALTRQLQEQVPTERLEQLASEIAERLGAISHLETETVEEQDDRATVRATVRVGAGEERTLELPLVKEEGFWRVASLEPLGALAPRS
jgi:hypothetical protein